MKVKNFCYKLILNRRNGLAENEVKWLNLMLDRRARRIYEKLAGDISKFKEDIRTILERLNLYNRYGNCFEKVGFPVAQLCIWQLIGIFGSGFYSISTRRSSNLRFKSSIYNIHSFQKYWKMQLNSNPIRCKSNKNGVFF